MENYKIENLSFCYPLRNTKALDNINLSIKQGEFITICGRSGSGKTTLLKHLKTTLTPHGETSGKIFFYNKDIKQMDAVEQAQKIGFVFQNPASQIVCDKVWHELAFGLESLGINSDSMQIRVAEIAAFFGISDLMEKDTNTLSGGQKQILNLASIMIMQPEVLLLDEPTSQLDPVFSTEFIHTVERINNELGITIIMTEHRLEDVLTISDRAIVIDNGKIIADGTPQEVGLRLKELNHEMFLAMPSAMQIYSKLDTKLDCPVCVKDGVSFLNSFLDNCNIIKSKRKINDENKNLDYILELSDIWFKYEKNECDILKGINFKVYKNTIHAIMGSNGAGKSTLVSIISKVNIPYRGKILLKGKKLSKISSKELFSNNLAVLGQNPSYLFIKDTVRDDLLDALFDTKLSLHEKDEKILNVASLVGINDFLTSHPFDLSGGEQQRAALAKVLLLSPSLLVLDEPTKGFDAFFKEQFAKILSSLKASGVTIVMVSHDLEFCARHTDYVSMIAGGKIITTKASHDFFENNYFYTTAANKISRKFFKGAIINEEVVRICQKSKNQN